LRRGQRRGGGYARAAAGRAPGPFSPGRPEKDRAGSDAGDPAGALDPLLPPVDLARAQGLLGAEAALRRVQSRAALLFEGQGDLTEGSSVRELTDESLRSNRKGRESEGENPPCSASFTCLPTSAIVAATWRSHSRGDREHGTSERTGSSEAADGPDQPEVSGPRLCD